MSDEVGKRVAAIQAGETFMTCKGCDHWQPSMGARSTSTIGWCMKNMYSQSAAPGGYMTQTRNYTASGVLNGPLMLTFDNSQLPMEYPVTTDLQCCSAWAERVS